MPLRSRISQGVNPRSPVSGPKAPRPTRVEARCRVRRKDAAVSRSSEVLARLSGRYFAGGLGGSSLRETGTKSRTYRSPGCETTTGNGVCPAPCEQAHRRSRSRKHSVPRSCATSRARFVEFRGVQVECSESQKLQKRSRYRCLRSYCLNGGGSSGFHPTRNTRMIPSDQPRSPGNTVATIPVSRVARWSVSHVIGRHRGRRERSFASRPSQI